MVKLKFEE